MSCVRVNWVRRSPITCVDCVENSVNLLTTSVVTKFSYHGTPIAVIHVDEVSLWSLEDGRHAMKKSITTFLTIAMLAISLPMLAGSASAQRRTSYNQDRYSRVNRNSQRIYRNNEQYYGQTNQQYYGYGYEQPSKYDKHRKAVNLAAGAGIGAIIGAIVGGKKGALIGGAAGLAGGAIVTAKQKPRNPNSEDYQKTNGYPYYY